MNDEELKQFNLIKAGSKDEFRKMYDQFRDVLMYRAVLLLKNRDEAKAALGSVFRAMWRNREKIQISGSLKDHLFEAITFDCRSRLERPQIVGGLVACIDLGRHGVNLSKDEFGTVIHAAIERLYPPSWQQIVKLFIVDNKSYYEIGCMLNMKANQVRSQFKRALIMLRLVFKAGL